MTRDEAKLFEKIVRAKVALEYKTVHTDWCHANDLTGHAAPCSCGAESMAKDQAIVRARSVLNEEWLPWDGQ
jgi:hypothetical protein